MNYQQQWARFNAQQLHRQQFGGNFVEKSKRKVAVRRRGRAEGAGWKIPITSCFRAPPSPSARGPQPPVPVPLSITICYLCINKDEQSEATNNTTTATTTTTTRERMWVRWCSKWRQRWCVQSTVQLLRSQKYATRTSFTLACQKQKKKGLRSIEAQQSFQGRVWSNSKSCRWNCMCKYLKDLWSSIRINEEFHACTHICLFNCT